MKTEICGSLCYDVKSPKILLGGLRNLKKPTWYSYDAKYQPDKFEEKLRYELKYIATNVVRIHVGGDFFCNQQVEVWIKLIKEFKEKKFFAYTRAWRDPEMYELLAQLRDIENMQLFASVDDQTGLPPKGWRVAQMTAVHDLKKSVVCPEQTGRKKNCLHCTLCFTDNKANITFILHGSGHKLDKEKVLRTVDDIRR